MTYDSGRHLTMLPSRGLRPTQIAPLSSRQSTYIYSNASRKVRIQWGLETTPQHSRLRRPPRSSSRHAVARAHACGAAIAATHSVRLLT